MDAKRPGRAEDVSAYHEARAWLDFAVHELPAGILLDPVGSTSRQCAEMLEGLEEFARLCARLDLADHDEFVAGCRWHFEHYPHYLGRRRHFIDYATYVTDRRGPLRLSMPPVPRKLRR